MTEFLRAIKRGRWYKYPEIIWLENGELQGDALIDIQTHSGRLSVFKVDNEVDKQRVLVAIAATKDHIANVDYAVFGDDGLDSLGIMMRSTAGDTPDRRANELHYELENLTVRQLAGLAEIISNGTHDRVQRKRVTSWLQDAARGGSLDRTRTKPNIAQKLPWGAEP